MNKVIIDTYSINLLKKTPLASIFCGISTPLSDLNIILFFFYKMGYESSYFKSNYLHLVLVIYGWKNMVRQ